jgi:hypothetical protein
MYFKTIWVEITFSTMQSFYCHFKYIITGSLKIINYVNEVKLINDLII